MKITVVGIGYVGLANAIMLSLSNNVVLFDINKDKVDMINGRKSPIKDLLISNYLLNTNLNLKATTSVEEAFENPQVVLICTPTNYDDSKNCFDTSSVEDSIKNALNFENPCKILIKSTIPVGFTKKMIEKFGYKEIYFSPEFLKEGSALEDCLAPSRIIVGHSNNKQGSQVILDILKENIIIDNPITMIMDSDEAEAVKLFANTYLANRIAFFNELDTYAESKDLSSENIIKGVCADPRIGDFYNNPSFGYGGYCLPKDTKQLNATYKDVPNEIISSVIKSNITRKDYIASKILAMSSNNKVVGIYRLSMKAGSDNYRNSSMLGIIKRLNKHNVKVIIYEPLCDEIELFDNEIIKNLEEFKKRSDIIVTNRYEETLDDVLSKVYTRDLFFKD